MRVRIKRVRMTRWYRVQRSLRLIEFPLLMPLRLPFWIRLAAIMSLFAIVFCTTMLLKIWRTTPPDFTPPIKISGLNCAQVWSLKHTARRDEAARRFDQAILAWHMAAAHNLGDVEASRGYLRALLQGDPKRTQISTAIGQTLWLLGLTRTNQADLELAVQIGQKYRQPELILRLLTSRDKPLKPELEAAYLKSLFDIGQVLKFAEAWPAMASRFATNVELRLDYSAYEAGWGPTNRQSAAWKELEAMQEDPLWRTVANRLQLAVSVRQRERNHYEQALQRLAEWRLDTPTDHVVFWRLLALAGDKDRAVQLARHYTIPPTTANDAMLMAEGLLELGLRDQARQHLETQIQQFSAAEGLWQIEARLLIQEQQWKALLALALKVRLDRRDQESLVGYSYYLEGRALAGQDKRTQARASFKTVPEFKFKTSPVGLEVAGGLLQVGFPDEAKLVLHQLDPYLTNNLGYWQLVFLAGNQTREADLMLKGAEGAMRLCPSNWVSCNNYAATLITLRQKPEAALQLTTRLLAQQSYSAGAIINHSQALLLNGRAGEADALLKRLEPSRLNPSELNAFYLASFEACLSQHRFEQAQEISERINRQSLFPSEAQWLEEARQRLPGPPPKNP
jgi:hypothetical protein